MKNIYLLLPVILLFSYNGCGSKDRKNNTEMKKPHSSEIPDSSTTLSNYEFSETEDGIIKLPGQLKEISGIVITPEGRLFAHNDESGIIFELDIKDGSIVKRFAVGKPAVKDDFEDIEYVSGVFYMVNSKGDIFRFRETEEQGYTDFEKFETALSSSYDVEGICYDSATNSLLLACKGFSGDQSSDSKAVFSFSLTDKSVSPKPRFVISSETAGKRFAPSGIRKNPEHGTFYIISATGNSIIEINADGVIVGKKELSPKTNEQPEGIAFMPDNSLVISNEGKSGKGYLVIYPRK